MKLTPGQLRQIIKEELGTFDKSVPKATRVFVGHETDPDKTNGEVLGGLKKTNKPDDVILVRWTIEDSEGEAKLMQRHRFDSLTFKPKKIIREDDEAFDLTAKITLPVPGGGPAYRSGRARREFIMTKKPYEFSADLIKKPNESGSDPQRVEQAYNVFKAFESARPGTVFSGLNPDDYYLYFYDSLKHGS